MSKERKPIRKIVKRQYFRTTNHPVSAGDSVYVTFECGHNWQYKASKEPKHSGGCSQCLITNEDSEAN